MNLMTTALLAALASPQAAETNAPSLPEPATARRVMEAQLDKAPPAQTERRRQSDAERERLMKLYLDAMGQPPERRAPEGAK